MSNTYRYALLWASVVALIVSAVLATTPAASRAQITWQGSYLTSPRPREEGIRLIQGHKAAPDVLPLSERAGILWQFSLGIFLLLLGFSFHALFLPSHDNAVPVRVRVTRRVPVASGIPFRRIVAYWYEMRL